MFRWQFGCSIVVRILFATRKEKRLRVRGAILHFLFCNSFCVWSDLLMEHCSRTGTVACHHTTTVLDVDAIKKVCVC